MDHLCNQSRMLRSPFMRTKCQLFAPRYAAEICFEVGWRSIGIADAHSDDGKRFIVRADEMLTAYPRTGIGDSRGELSDLASYEIGLSKPTCAARQPSQAKRNRAEKLLSRHRERQPLRSRA